MYYFIISEKNVSKISEYNSVCIIEPTKSDFILTREKNREVKGQFSIVADIPPFNIFEEKRKQLYKWTKNSYDCYLNILMVKKNKIEIRNERIIEYEITGFDEGYIVNFGEDYDNDLGNTMNLVLNQRNNTEIGMLETTNKVIETISGAENLREVEKSGFKQLNSEKISKMLRFMEKQIIEEAKHG